MTEEAMPVIGFGDRVPRPVRFSVSMKMIRVSGYFWSVSLQTYQLRAFDAWRTAPRALEPGVLVRCMIDHQFGDDANTAPLRFR